MTHAIIIALLFWQIMMGRKRDFLNILPAVGFLVKPITLLVVIPFLLYGTSRNSRMP